MNEKSEDDEKGTGSPGNVKKSIKENPGGGPAPG